MKKIFTFKENIMNGTVTMSSKVVAFASRELAEKTRQAVIAANRDNEPGYKMCPSEITETEVFETEDDVFILSGKNEHKEDEKWPSGMGYIHIGTPEAVEDYLKREREGKLTISERRPAWETADCWNALDYKTFERIFKMAIDDDASMSMTSCDSSAAYSRRRKSSAGSATRCCVWSTTQTWSRLSRPCATLGFIGCRP